MFNLETMKENDLSEEEITALNKVLNDQIKNLDDENKEDGIKDIEEGIISYYSDLRAEGKALFLWLVDDQKRMILPSDIEEQSYDYFNAPQFEVESEEYVIIPDCDIEGVFHDYAEELIDDCIIDSIPERYRGYFDYDKFIQDISFDGYGQMASYDGADNEQKYNGEYYHILRMN